MKNIYMKQYFFTLLMIASLVVGIVFFVTNHLDFIIAAIDSNKLNLPNVAYIFLRILSGIVLPAIFLVPSVFEFGRIKLTKAVFIACGILQLITLSWIFYFLAANPFGDLFSQKAIIDFQSNIKHPFVSTYVFWDTYGWIGSFFTLAYSILMIYTGISFDDNRKIVKRCMISLLICKLLFPTLSNLLFNHRWFPMFWITNNYADLISFVLLGIAIISASLHDRTWINFVWDQHGIDEEDDDFFDMNETKD